MTDAKRLGKLRISEECGSVSVDHLDVEGEKLVTGPVASRLSRSYEVCHDDDGKRGIIERSECNSLWRNVIGTFLLTHVHLLTL
jgi:hypothetical protein